MNESKSTLFRVIQDRYIKITWSHKVQERQGDIYIKKSRRVKTHIVWFTVLTTGGTLYSILPWLDGSEGKIWGTWLTAVFAMFLSYFTLRYNDGQLEDRAKECKLKAWELHNLRNKYESLLADMKANLLTDEELVCRRNDLREEEHKVYRNAPYTSKKAVKLADKDLIQNKESTTEERERDTILPDYLRNIDS